MRAQAAAQRLVLRWRSRYSVDIRAGQRPLFVATVKLQALHPFAQLAPLAETVDGAATPVHMLLQTLIAGPGSIHSQSVRDRPLLLIW